MTPELVHFGGQKGSWEIAHQIAQTVGTNGETGYMLIFIGLRETLVMRPIGILSADLPQTSLPAEWEALVKDQLTQ